MVEGEEEMNIDHNIDQQSNHRRRITASSCHGDKDGQDYRHGCHAGPDANMEQHSQDGHDGQIEG